MEEQVVKKRAWVKNAVIVFLSIMLVLTFFSNTIMNRALPEVATSYVESGSINAKIRGSGTVTAGESYEVVLDQSRQVSTVLVRVGDTVMAGDLLFTLAEQESGELKAAMDELERLRLAYEQMLLTMDTADYAQENRNIQKARDALKEAQAELTDTTVTDQQVLEAQAALKEAQRSRTDLEDALLEAQEALTASKSEHTTLQAQIKSQNDQLDDLDEEIEKLEDQLDDLRSGTGSADRELREAEAELEEIEEEYAKLRVKYGAAYDSLKDKAQELVSGGDLLVQMQALVDAFIPPTDPTAAPPVSNIATAEEVAAFKALKQTVIDLEDAREEVDRLQDLVDGAASVQEQIDTLRDTIDQKEEELSDLAYDLRTNKKLLTVLENTMEGAQYDVEQGTVQLETADEAIEQLTEQYDALKAKQDRYAMAKDKVKSCQETLDDLLFALAQQQKADGKTAAEQQWQLDNEQRKILEQEELVAELQAHSLGAEVTAGVSGQITSLSVVAGREAVAGETLAVIEVVDRGYTVRLPVTTEQSKKVRVGDKADVTNYYWGEQIDATLTQITNDPQNPGKGKLLVFTLNGDISSGQNVTLAVGERSANFDSIIPKSALRTDTNGSFVLVITAKSSPLGNRYIATRADVQVLAQDDTRAAVSGLSMGDWVITTSSRPLEAGMQVNMLEN